MRTHRPYKGVAQCTLTLGTLPESSSLACTPAPGTCSELRLMISQALAPGGAHLTIPQVGLLILKEPRVHRLQPLGASELLVAVAVPSAEELRWADLAAVEHLLHEHPQSLDIPRDRVECQRARRAGRWYESPRQLALRAVVERVPLAAHELVQLVEANGPAPCARTGGAGLCSELQEREEQSRSELLIAAQKWPCVEGATVRKSVRRLAHRQCQAIERHRRGRSSCRRTQTW